MKRLTKRIARRHDARIMMAAHPRSYDVMPADAADVLEPMLPEPFVSVLTVDDVDGDDMRAWDCGHWLSSDDILNVRDRHRWRVED
jgi:hypothetical protein